EALAMEKPVVTNATGAEALSSEVRDVLVLAEGEREIARKVGQLLDDPRRRRVLGARGRAAMARHHSWDAAAGAYEELLEELAVRNR
ncbi:MAG: glycosyltransferase, partial [Planctomycetota bacterium]